jgi:hypothetical protein
MRRPPGKVDTEITAFLTEQARLRVLTKTLKQISHSTGLARSTVQSHLSRLVKRERQKVVSHGTKDQSHLSA